MDYFAGLDISMDETHLCVLDREGEVIWALRTPSFANSAPRVLRVASHAVIETLRLLGLAKTGHVGSDASAEGADALKEVLPVPLARGGFAPPLGFRQRWPNP